MHSCLRLIDYVFFSVCLSLSPSVSLLLACGQGEPKPPRARMRTEPQVCHGSDSDEAWKCTVEPPCSP